MPTYVYECQACGSTFEREQRITEDRLTEAECAACHAVRPVKRLIQPVAIAFRGEGFHINDYAPKAPVSEEKPAEAKPAEAKPEGAAKGTEATPETSPAPPSSSAP